MRNLRLDRLTSPRARSGASVLTRGLSPPQYPRALFPLVVALNSSGLWASVELALFGGRVCQQLPESTGF